MSDSHWENGRQGAINWHAIDWRKANRLNPSSHDGRIAYCEAIHRNHAKRNPAWIISLELSLEIGDGNLAIALLAL